MPKVGHNLRPELRCMQPYKRYPQYPASRLAYATAQSVGLDLAANCGYSLRPGETLAIATGWCVEIPEGFEGQVRPRSSLSSVGIQVQLGTVDADYRGEIRVIVYNSTGKTYSVHCADRVAQLVISPVLRVAPIEVASLPPTERGTKGFGSTGR